MTLNRWLIAAALCSLSGCAGAAQIISFLGSVHVIGKIERGDAKKLDDKLRSFDAPPTVFLVSQGGFLEASLEVATVIRQRAAKLRLTGPCVSACASALLASHPVREARKTAVVAFHATDTGWMTQALAEMRRIAAQDPAFAAQLGEFLQRSEIEVPALEARLHDEMRRAGMDVSMFVRASHATRQRLTHLSFDAADRRLDIDKASATTCSYWVPDEQELAAMGVVFSGGYRRLPPDELARILNVARSELLLHLDDADAQCVERPTVGPTPSAAGRSASAPEPAADNR